VKINYNGNPFKSDNGFLPYLEDNGKKFSGYDKIISHIAKSQDKTFPPAPSQMAYLHECLYPFFMYNLFGNPQNTDEMRTLYALRTPFPFNFYCPGKYFRKTDEICKQIGNFSTEDKIDQHNTTEMSFKAKKCLNWINDRLAKSNFFVGDEPCEIDATIYAYVAIIIKYQLPNNQLQSHGNQNENLVKYVNKITNNYFHKDELFESEKAKEKSAKSEQKVFTGQEDEDPPAVVRRRYILSGLFATTAMLSYAVLTGMFKVLIFKLTNNPSIDNMLD
jgi:metaxin